MPVRRFTPPDASVASYFHLHRTLGLLGRYLCPEIIPLAHALVAAGPDRLFWGTDWPHANHAGEMPNSTDLFDLLLDWAPDERDRTRILVDNPAQFYGF